MLCYILLAEIAFQFLLKTWSEVLEIVLFVGILAAFLVSKLAVEGPRGLMRILVGTWTQRLAALFVLALMSSFLWGDHSSRSIFALLRLPTYLVIIAMVADAVREEKRIPSFSWIILGGIAFIFMLTLAEYYFGSDLLGLKCADVERCMTWKEEGWHWNGLLATQQMPDPFYGRENLRATVMAEAYGISRLALFAILAYALGLGLMVASRRWASKLIAGSLLTIIVFGVFASGSRSATLAIPIVFASFITLSAVSLPRTMVPLTVSGIAVLAGAFLMLLVLPTGTTAFDRILGRHTDRFEWDFADYASIDAPPGVKIVGAGIRNEDVAIIAYLIDDRRHRDDDDPVQDWRWQRGQARSDDAAGPDSDDAAEPGDDTESVYYARPDNDTWTEVEGALDRRYALTGHDIGKFLRGYTFYEKNGDTYLAVTPAIGPIRGLSARLRLDEWRFRNWKLALELFADNPLGGSGYRTFQPEARARFPDTKTIGVHSGYLKILSESGLLGALPLLAVLACAAWMMWRFAPGASAEATLWRNAFLSAFATMLVVDLIDTHSSDRYYWIVLSFAAVAEIWRRQNRVRTAGETATSCKP